jgi:hypothetical protein
LRKISILLEIKDDQVLYSYKNVWDQNDFHGILGQKDKFMYMGCLAPMCLNVFPACVAFGRAKESYARSLDRIDHIVLNFLYLAGTTAPLKILQ